MISQKRGGMKILLVTLFSVVFIFFICLAAKPGTSFSKSFCSQSAENQKKDLGIPEPKMISLSVGESIIVEEYKLEIILKEVRESAYADLELMFSERNSYDGLRHTAGDTRWRANPSNYPSIQSADLLNYAKVLYRTHRYCTGRIRRDIWKNGLEIIELAGYGNVVGKSRFYEQCFLDGSFDSYYEEYCDYGTVCFQLNEIKNAAEFSIKVESIGPHNITIVLTFLGDNRYGPINYEPN